MSKEAEQLVKDLTGYYARWEYLQVPCILPTGGSRSMYSDCGVDSERGCEVVNTVDIVEVIDKSIEETILKEWRHDGYMDGMYGNGLRCVIDGKHYVIEIREEQS